MERVIDLTETVRQNVMDYSTPVLKGRSFFLENIQQRTYAVVTVAEYEPPHSEHNGIVVLARIEDDKVLVEEDNTDRPLWKELVRAGIPREKIVLVYAGEQIPAKDE